MFCGGRRVPSQMERDNVGTHVVRHEPCLGLWGDILQLRRASLKTWDGPSKPT